MLGQGLFKFNKKVLVVPWLLLQIFNSHLLQQKVWISCILHHPGYIYKLGKLYLPKSLRANDAYHLLSPTDSIPYPTLLPLQITWVLFCENREIVGIENWFIFHLNWGHTDRQILMEYFYCYWIYLWELLDTTFLRENLKFYTQFNFNWRIQNNIIRILTWNLKGLGIWTLAW